MGELEQNIWLPPAASTAANEVDPLYYFILWASTAFFAIVLVAIIYFVKKYRKDGVREKLEPQVSHDSKLEFFWTAIPTILIIIVFFWGARGFLRMQIWPVDAMEVQLYANAWKFDFLYSYDDTQFKSDSLVVPVGTPVRVTMTAEESQPIHSFYVPDFRIKKDIMANRYSQTWFESNYEGTYDYYCTEYCGEKHSLMNGHVVVMPKLAEDFVDVNGNEIIDSDEKYTDSNANGKWDVGEYFLDIGNGKWDDAESFEDLNGNGKYDEDETFTDCNRALSICYGDDDWSPSLGNGVWDAAEEFTDCDENRARCDVDKAEEFEDANGNNKYDDGEKYTDSNGNGKWDRDWRKEDGNGEYNLGEPFVDIGDGKWTPAEQYTDSNGNGKWDTGYDYWFKRKIAEHKASNLLAGAALGEKVYGDYNCNTCHSNGMNAGGVGPSFVGLWERKLKEYSSSQDPELEARNYINESIRYPNRYIVPGYPDQMPKTYTEENGFSNEYISGLIEYIKTLK